MRILDGGATQLEANEGGLDDSLARGGEWAEDWMRDNYETEAGDAEL